MSMTVNSGAESERHRRREIIAGFIGRVAKSQQAQLQTKTAREEEMDCSIQ